MNKKILVLSLIFILAFSQIVSAGGYSFSDVENSWALEHINWAVDMKIINGYPDGTFRPEENITRAEFLKMLNILLGSGIVEKVYYEDIPKNAWYYNDIGRAIGFGYLPSATGYFYPDRQITREEACYYIARAYRRANDKKSSLDFNDVSSIQYKDEVGALVNSAVIKGYEDNTFRPNNPLRRDEATKILHVAFSVFNKTYSKYYYSDPSFAYNKDYEPYEEEEEKIVKPYKNYVIPERYEGFGYYNNSVRRLQIVIEDAEKFLNEKKYTQESERNLRNAIDDGKSMLDLINYRDSRYYDKEYLEDYYKIYGKYPEGESFYPDVYFSEHRLDEASDNIRIAISNLVEYCK